MRSQKDERSDDGTHNLTCTSFMPIQEAIASFKLVPSGSQFVVASRALDISFGDLSH
jgi:hypothetical protein